MLPEPCGLKSEAHAPDSRDTTYLTAINLRSTTSVHFQNQNRPFSLMDSYLTEHHVPCSSNRLVFLN